MQRDRVFMFWYDMTHPDLFDFSDTKKEFGPVVIDYGKVQSKVSLKYDSWHKDALGKFGHMLGNEMSEFHSQVSKSRVDLEQQSVEAASTSEAVNFITYVQVNLIWYLSSR